MSVHHSLPIEGDDRRGRHAERSRFRAGQAGQAAARVAPGTEVATERIVELQRTAGNQAVARMLRPAQVPAARPAARRLVLQRMQVTDLQDKHTDGWFAIQGNAVAKFSGISEGKWEFRVKDNMYGKSQFVYLTEGKVVPLPNFGVVLAKQYGNDEENWFGEQAARLDVARRQWGRVAQVSYEDLLKVGTEELSKSEVTEYDATFVMPNGGIWTDGMGPCITVAMTGVCGDVRVNALHHSFVTHYDPRKYPQVGEDIVVSIKKGVESATGQPFSATKEQRFYVVGGDKATAKKMASLLTEMLMFQELNVVGIADTTTEPGGASSKAVLITPEGNVIWSRKAK